jgi:hypothetical protein
LNLFQRFCVVSERVVVSHLQYADDILCTWEAAIANLWMMKAVLRGFEMVSGLKVNYSKSFLVGVNVSHEFFNSTCTFFNYRVSMIPFKYLGLPDGAKPRNISPTNLGLINFVRHLARGARSIFLLEVGLCYSNWSRSPICYLI